MSVSIGELVATVRLSDEVSAELEALTRRLDVYSRLLPQVLAAALMAETRREQPIAAALLGAAAAAVLLPTPVSRRRLLFPWLGRRA